MIRPGKSVLDISGEGAASGLWDLVREDEEDAHLNRERVFEDGDALIWKVPNFFITRDTITSIISRARKHKRLVLDLRGNPGGSVEVLKYMLGQVFDHEVKLGDRVSRKNTKSELIKPSGSPFNGKLIVLVNSDSGSAAQLIARVIQIEHRGAVIGDRSRAPSWKLATTTSPSASTPRFSTASP